MELVPSYDGDLVAAPGAAGAQVPVWLENPAALATNQVQCYAVPRVVPAPLSTPAMGALQTGLMPGGYVGDFPR